MTKDGPSSPDSEHRILSFRRRSGGARRPFVRPPPADDLAKYARGGENDDYRHRMIVNAAALLFVAALIGTGLWLAQSMAELRRNQDCVMSGRRNCAPIEVNKDRF
jgi:hypothetical protein